MKMNGNKGRICRQLPVLSALLLTLASGTAKAQDVHFSQFWETSVLRNPALVGVFTGDYKISALYRTQWQSIGSPFTTALLHAEVRKPVRVQGNSSDFLSFGLAAYSDVAGSVSLKTSAVYPSVTYNKKLQSDRGSYLSAGFTGGYLVRSYDASKMTFDNQWVGGAYNSSAPTNENLTNPKLQTFDVGAGLAFSSTFGEENENSYFLGLGAYHLTQPQQTFQGRDATLNLSMRWSANGGLAMRLGEMYRLEAQANISRQGAATEVIAGGLLSWQQRPDRGQAPTFSVGAGAYYRISDALIPLVRVTYKTLSFTGSYDVTVSTLRAATSLRGAYEISVVHAGLFRNAMDDRGRTECPTF
jgi:type IX secretion system PorP/SprF family membrane protein